jgi:ADP-heptose:LPS heptosyltransferase/glycosyltransferase involved in cell wall biosynthesis
MTAPAPLVTIGLPVYNGERHLRRALDALLAQDLPSFELIISDNCSTDGTEAICREYAGTDPRIRYVRHGENRGSIWNFEFVLAEGRCPYFLWAAHDDAYAPGFLSKCLARLEACPQAIACCSELVFWDERGEPKPGWSYLNFDTPDMAPAARALELFRRMGWFATYSLYRREVLLRTLPLPTGYGCDVLHLLDLLLEGEIVKVPEPLLNLTVADQERTEDHYLEKTTGGPNGAAKSQPYSGLLRELWCRAHASPRLKDSDKAWLFEQIVRVIAYENLDWRGRIQSEQGLSIQDPGQVRAFARFLGARLAEAVAKQAEEVEPGRMVLLPPSAKRALVFFPHNPWPARSGAHSRCLAVLEGLQALGYEIGFCGSTQFTDQAWTPEAQEVLERKFGAKIYLHEPDGADTAWSQSFWANPKGLNLQMHCPPGLRRLFFSLQQALRAEVVLVNYCQWAGLVDGEPFLKPKLILDSLDLMAPNLRLWQALAPRIPADLLAPVDPSVPWLADDCGEALRGAPREEDEEEFQAYDRFDVTLAISEPEAQVLEAHCRRTHVARIPMSRAVPAVENTYLGRPLFVASDNPLNQQGYLYFVSRVLPLIRAELPGFEIGVVGSLCRRIQPIPGVVPLGFVEDLTALYAGTSFTLCPSLVGTGQQVKVPESMAHGVPVVVHRAVADASPVIHEVNGLIPGNPESFAACCVRLAKDPELCQRLGREARRTMETQGSLAFLVERLKQVLDRPKPALPGAPEPRRILYVRTDSIGDALLSNSILPHLRNRWPDGQITVVCQERLDDLYRACPHVDGVLTFDRSRAIGDESYRRQLTARIQSVGADLALCPVFSREVLTDLLVAASQAPQRLGLEGDLSNQSVEEKAKTDGLYTRLIPIGEGSASELDRHRDFLTGLGIEAEDLQPQVWTSPEDEAFAEAYLRDQGLSGEKLLAFFPGAQYDMRVYGGYRPVLQRLLDRGWRVLAFGSPDESGLCDAILQGLAGWTNLCGQVSLPQLAALLRRCELGLGAESGLAHLCVAVGLRNAVVLGGGHFGRFCPTSPLTTVAALPLDCYFCNWQCRFNRPHCVKDLSPEVLWRAVELAQEPADRPRLVAQLDGFQAGASGPAILDLRPLLNHDEVECFTVSVADSQPPPEAPPLERADQSATGGPLPARTTVICAVWHRDPDRHDLLGAHQACLDAQTVPVERIYVFDGGDPPPEGLQGKVVATGESLTIYEAWNLALPLVRTPYVMNLNLDDRLTQDGAARFEAELDAGADLAAGDWRITFSREETDRPEPSFPARDLPVFRLWPPPPGEPARLGSSAEAWTLGPACAWKMVLHQEFPRFPWKFGGGSLIRTIGDGVWWRILQQAGKRLVRMPWVIGHYHSHPADQAEFRNPPAVEEDKLTREGIAQF